jgi:hypothetical protein
VSVHPFTAAVLGAGAIVLAGCVTNIKPQEEAVQPSKVRFGTFQQALLKPLDTIQASELDAEAARRIDVVLAECMQAALPQTRRAEGPVPAGSRSTLVIEPVIVDAKKVTVGQRIMFGALAGSSAALMRVKFTDARTGEVVAEPTFYARAAAMAGAWSFGAHDNSMLSRLPQSACDYVRSNA